MQLRVVFQFAYLVSFHKYLNGFFWFLSFLPASLYYSLWRQEPEVPTKRESMKLIRVCLFLRIFLAFHFIIYFLNELVDFSGSEPRQKIKQRFHYMLLQRREEGKKLNELFHFSFVIHSPGSCPLGRLMNSPKERKKE